VVDARRQDAPQPRASARAGRTEVMRRMVLLLETAEVLEARARRCPDPAQAAVLLRRAKQRRQQAAGLREGLPLRVAAAPLRTGRGRTASAAAPGGR
jgi:hypothetical protein